MTPINNGSISSQTPPVSYKNPVIKTPSTTKIDLVAQAGITKPRKKPDKKKREFKLLTIEEQFKLTKKSYKHLFNCVQIIEVDDDFPGIPSNHLIPDVGEDKKLVVSASQCPYLGTSGVVDCLTYCGRGKTNTGEIYLGMAHSPGNKPKDVLESITESFLSKGCLKETLEFYVVGGVEPYDENKYGSLKDEMKVLKLSKEHPILGVSFNIAIGEMTSLAIILTEKNIYFSDTAEFNAEPEDAGEDI